MKIAFYTWGKRGDLVEAITHELNRLGAETTRFLPQDPVPSDVDFIFTYAPYGPWAHIPAQISQFPKRKRPFLIHWNTEGLPSPRIPVALTRVLGIARTRLDRILGPTQRMLRFRYVGDYLQLNQSGIPFLLADISAINTAYFQNLGIPCINVPFASSELWSADLDLERDIDVLWMGARATRRRSRLLDRIEAELAGHGIHLRIIDGEREPFIFGDARTHLLNRTRIVLNLARTDYDDNTLRLFIAMPNRAMIVSEVLPRHNPQLQPGIHFAEAPTTELVDTIRHFLSRPEL